MIGRTFGDFVIRELVGEGGAGQVYRAEQITLGREAVIKLMARRTEFDQAGADRFLREARLASQLDHPFAAHVYGFGAEPDGGLWIAMELVRGVALNTLISQQGPVPLPRFVPLFERLCDVVQTMHDQGIIHRDIKPANVMIINRAGRLLPKLLDLGIARRASSKLELESPVTSGRNELVHLPLTQTFGATHGQGEPHTTLAESDTLQLTQLGAVVGTPHYMAPEQWSEATSVDARADIYSLSLLAYQALTGKLPFEGKSIRSLARAHATQALPPLPDGFPSALYDVLSKGAAKQPLQRFATAVELAAAVRAASGIGGEAFELPQLADDIREIALSEAPQPIAEAVALLEAARTPRQQVDALDQVRRVAIRHVAILALACRGRVGPGTHADAPQVVALLEKLAKDQLADHDWLALATELVRPFAFRKLAHPVPELVSFFFAEAQDTTPGPGVAALTTLDHLGTPPRDAPDDVLHSALLKLVPAAGLFLRSLGFLYDYPLVVRHADVDRWMGTRRVRRLTQTVTDAAAMPLGRPMMVDAVGAPVVPLWPLLQVFEPGAGLAEELFYLDGSGRHGARMVAMPGPFERQSEDVWPWVSEHVLDVMAAQASSALTDKPPYKGLSTFTSDDADNYFGREREAETFANRLRLAPLLAVVGPSGSGKSSFVLAGVLPLLPDGWRAVVTRPGAAPLQALAQRLATAFGSVGELTAQGIVNALAPHESLLLVVDQFEELVTLCADTGTRTAFAELLVNVAERSGGRVKVVLTLRDDFLIRVQQLPPLRERLSSALQLLSTPARDELLRVVTEPARRVGYGFDDVTLPATMVDEVAEYPGALALLSFTASQLWELRDRHLKQMRAKTYQALGGVGGALAHHAEMTLAQMSEGEAKLVREAFRHLVTSQGTRAVMSRRELLEVLGEPTTGAAVIDRLVTARLLVTSEAEGTDDRVEIIHEALIVAWPRLVGWLREDTETARLRDSLRASARQWEERGRPRGLLWRAETLAEYRVWRRRFRGRLTVSEEAFANASLGDELRGRRVRQGLGLAVLVGLVSGLITLYRSNEESKANAAEAKTRLTDLRVEQARLAALDEKPFQTLLFSTEAKKLGAANSTIDYLERRASKKLAGEEAWRMLGEAVGVVASRQGDRLATLGASGSFKLFAVQGLTPLLELPPSGGELDSFAFLPDGHSGVLCRNDKTVNFVRDDGSSPTRLLSLTEPIFACAVDPQGTTLAVIQIGGRLSLWQLGPDGVLGAHTELELGADFGRLVFSPNGKFLVSMHGLFVESGSNAFCVLVDVQRSRIVARLPSGIDRTLTVAFSSDSGLFATGGRDNVGRVYSTATGALLAQLTGHSDWINAMQFSPDDKVLLTASNDRSVRLWSTGGALQTTFTHNAGVTYARFLDAQRVVTATSDGTVHWWVTGLSAPTISFFGHASDLSGFDLVDPVRFVTSASDGMLRVWNTRSAESVFHFAVPEEISYALPSKDGRWAMTGPDQGEFARWSLPHGELIDRMKVEGCHSSVNMAMTFDETPLVASSEGNDVCVMQWAPHAKARRLSGHSQQVRRVEFSNDGRFLASSSADQTVIVWNVASGERLALLKHDSSTRGIGFSSDGARLVVGTQDGSIVIWRWRDERRLFQWPVHGNGVYSAEFTDSDRLVLTGSMDQHLALTEVETGKIKTHFTGHSQTVTRAHMHPDGALMASIDWYGNIFVWDVQKGWAVDRILAGGATNDVRWLPGGGLITALGERSRVMVYQPTDAVTRDWSCFNPLTLATNVVAPRTEWNVACRSR